VSCYQLHNSHSWVHHHKTQSLSQHSAIVHCCLELLQLRAFGRKYSTRVLYLRFDGCLATASTTDNMTSTPQDPKTLYLYTSLTAGSSYTITATSRLELLLKAHKIPFIAIDVATDDKARSIWGRRSGGKKLPGLVKDKEVLGVSRDPKFPTVS